QASYSWYGFFRFWHNLRQTKQAANAVGGLALLKGMYQARDAPRAHARQGVNRLGTYLLIFVVQQADKSWAAIGCVFTNGSKGSRRSFAHPSISGFQGFNQNRNCFSGI